LERMCRERLAHLFSRFGRGVPAGPGLGAEGRPRMGRRPGGSGSVRPLLGRLAHGMAHGMLAMIVGVSLEVPVGPGAPAAVHGLKQALLRPFPLE
jgi:hypothetical protein